MSYILMPWGFVARVLHLEAAGAGAFCLVFYNPQTSPTLGPLNAYLINIRENF